MSTIHILAILPHISLRPTLEKMATRHQHLDLTIAIGDLDQGLAILERASLENFDGIISRGGTATLLSEKTELPVIDIPISTYDLLRTLKLATPDSGRIAVMGFPSVIKSAVQLSQLLQIQLDTYPIHQKSEALKVIATCKANQYDMVLCDTISHEVARSQGVNAMLIHSGSESVQEALATAMQLGRKYQKIKKENHFLREVLATSENHTMILDKKGEVVFSSTLLDKKAIGQLSEGSFFNIDNDLYTVHFSQKGGHTFIQFNKVQPDLQLANSGIFMWNFADIEQKLTTPFYHFLTPELSASLETFQVGRHPLFIHGATGTGKFQVATLLYAQSQATDFPFVMIDCSLISEKSWKFFMTHYASPLQSANCTFYLCKMEKLPKNRQKELLTYLFHQGLEKHHRFIFAVNTDSDASASLLNNEFITSLNGLTLLLPSLKEQSEHLLRIVNLYLNELNMELGMQVLGFDNTATNTITTYHWPGNYTELKQVLKDAVLQTQAPYITGKLLEKIIGRKKTEENTPQRKWMKTLNMNRSLEEINQDVVHYVLEQSEGNQSRAAKKLGISRTTLWRMLN